MRHTTLTGDRRKNFSKCDALHTLLLSVSDSIHDGKRMARQPRRFELVVNLKTAGTLRVDEVIE